MIITRSPLRVSFIGGGTDFEKFYSVNKGGVISTAIDKYVYVTCLLYTSPSPRDS